MISKTYTDRVAKPWYLKLFIPWWFANSYEPNPPDDYLSGRPRPWRLFCWYCRNPLVNFCDFVVGVSDRNYTAYGQGWPDGVSFPGDPIEVTDWHDYGLTGWKLGAINIAKIFWLPYVSYSGKRVLWHVGWYSFGRFQIKFNILK